MSSPDAQGAEEAIRVAAATAAHVDAIVAGNLAMARETEGLSLDRAAVERGVSAVFEDPTRGFYLVALRPGDDGGEDVVGQLLVTYEWSDWRDGRLWWIQSVWVAPSARRQGVYRALHQRVVDDARRQRAVGVRLYVAQQNTVAQATYRMMGMVEAPYRMFEIDFVLDR